MWMAIVFVRRAVLRQFRLVFLAFRNMAGLKDRWTDVTLVKSLSTASSQSAVVPEPSVNSGVYLQHQQGLVCR